MNMNKKYPWLAFILLVILALAAGLGGEIIARVYIFKDFSVPYLSRDLNVSSLGVAPGGLVISNPQKVVVNADAKLTETVNSLNTASVRVFRVLESKNQSSSSPAFYNLEKPLFIGLIITSDGWIAANVPAEIKRDFNPKNYVAVASDRRIYSLDRLSPQKNLPADLLLFHLSGANNLNVVRIAKRSDLSPGQSLLVIDRPGLAWPATLVEFQKNAAGPALSSDNFDSRLSLSAATSFKNAFVFDLGGNLAAFIGASGNVLPAFNYIPYWRSLLDPKIPDGRPYLGVNYLDLSRNLLISSGPKVGAQLYSNPNHPAVAKNSPAQAAGLQAGDIITWVNNQEIGAGRDLADLIAEYNPGDKITLTYRRQGADYLVDVVLGTLK